MSNEKSKELEAARRLGVRAQKIDLEALDEEAATLIRQQDRALEKLQNEMLSERTLRQGAEAFVVSLQENLFKEREACARRIELQQQAVIAAEARAAAAEALASERGLEVERLAVLATMPKPLDDPRLERVLSSLDDLPAVLSSQRMPVALPSAVPTFELTFTRDRNGMIKSPVTAVPKLL